MIDVEKAFCCSVIDFTAYGRICLWIYFWNELCNRLRNEEDEKGIIFQVNFRGSLRALLKLITTEWLRKMLMASCQKVLKVGQQFQTGVLANKICIDINEGLTHLDM